MFASTGKTKWLCRQCFKHLSSKRSYDEHMNIHNESRPFACDQCDYSAASQMTLRRHKLRNHIPRQAWGYQCPYCGEAYMEPASYQQHVLTRHFGYSATFGCRHSGCSFTTKSSKHFRNHLTKHNFITSVRKSTTFVALQPKYDVAKHLIDDELGSGYGKPPLIPVAHRVSTLPLIKKSLVSDDFLQGSTSKDVEFMIMDKDYLKTPMDLGSLILRSDNSTMVPRRCAEDQNISYDNRPPTTIKSWRDEMDPPPAQYTQECNSIEPLSSDRIDWVEEIVIEEQTAALPVDFELD